MHGRDESMSKNLNASTLIAWLKAHVGDGYVYGTVGQICTVSLLTQKQRQYGKTMGNGYYQLNGDYSKGLCARWLSDWVADCSGLIKAGRRDLTGTYKDVSAEGTYQQCSKKGKIGTMPLIPGCTVYMWSASERRMGHVGMYIGGGWVIEARGVRYGVVKTPLIKRLWGYWGLLDWLSLDLPQEGGSPVPAPDAQGGGSDSAGPMPDDKPCDGIPSMEALGDSGYTVMLLQQWLNLHGANPKIQEDGVFGQATEAAVNAFKLGNSLPNDGVACIQTWSKLIVPLPSLPLNTLQTGDSGLPVTLLQRLLYTAGLTPWGIDGKFGANTETAVKVYQKAHGLVADGVVGPKTWAALTAAQPTVPATVKKGDSSPEVLQLQKLLDAMGFPPGAVDGIFGSQTESALMAYQSAVNLTADGIAGPPTWAKITSGEPAIPPTVKMGDSGGDVERLQGLLIDQGYAPGAMDGVFGSKTEAAAKAFQAANHLTADGIVGPKTWSKLLGIT